MVYENDDLASITNTVLFDVHDNQVNYNTIFHSAGQSSFEATKDQASFELDTQIGFRYLYLFLIGLPLFVLFIAEAKVAAIE